MSDELKPALNMSLDSIEKCRNIHNQIIDYGVSEQEKIKLISLMSMELEDVFLMKKIQNVIKNEPEHENIQETKKEKLIL